MNDNRVYYQPLIYAVMVVAGIWIARAFLFQDGSTSSSGSRVAQLLEIIESQYVDTVDRHHMEDDAIRKLLQELDPHSIYIPAREVERVNQGLKGSFVGIGVEFENYKDTVLVLRVIANGPADEAGLRVGDRILSVLEQGDTAGHFSLIGLDNDVIIERLKGRAGSPIEVKLFRKSDSTYHTIEILRDNIAIPSITSFFMVEPGIGYIRIERFGEPTHKEFRSAIASLRTQGNMDKLVIDLRNNPGGYLRTAINLLDEFFSDNELLAYTEGKGRYKKEYRATSGGLCTDVDLVCLVNGYSASASEIFTGAIQDHDRGLIVGTRTYGKGLVQENFRLSDGSQLRLTVSRYYVPSGRLIQKPYDVDLEQYHREVRNRMDSSFTSVDSSHIYHTSAGRVVFGGGGIQPDVVAIDRPDTLFSGAEYRVVRTFLAGFSDDHFALITSYRSADSLKAAIGVDTIMQTELPIVVNSEQLNFIKEELSSRFYGPQETNKAFAGQDVVLQRGLRALNEELSLLEPVSDSNTQ